MGSAVSDLSWRPLGACRDQDPNLFYPQRGESIVAAVAICAVCPVKADCLDWALHHEKLGIWGGTSERGRRRIRKVRGVRLTTPQTVANGAGHGTSAGYQSHRRNREPACEACRQAHNANQAEAKRTQRALAAAR
jgi:WhiB family redox-sensing transcriptional regulator